MKSRSPENKERCQRMAELYRSGKTLQQIGDEYGLTRERVRQLLGSLGMNGESGGARVHAIAAAREKHQRSVAREEEKYFKWFGCSKAVFLEIDPIPYSATDKRRYLKKSPASAYFGQKVNAKKRGIEWAINFPDWWRVWKDSGKWHKRGRGKGYCMARHGDSGPYSVDNVYICTIGQNFSDSYLVSPWEKRFQGSKRADRDELGLTKFERLIYDMRAQGKKRAEIAEATGKTIGYLGWAIHKIEQSIGRSTLKVAA